MADELPCAVWKRVDDHKEGFDIEGTRVEDPDRTVGGAKPVAFDFPLIVGRETTKHSQLRYARPKMRIAEDTSDGHGKKPAERIANRRDTATLRGAQQGPQHHRKHVSMLVTVEMRQPDSGILQPLHLGGSFGFDLRRIELVG